MSWIRFSCLRKASLLGVIFFIMLIYYKFKKTVVSQPSVGGRVYIITQTYGGQMTRAIRNMMVQQCWGGTFQKGERVYIVEPFSSESELIHDPQLWNGKGYLDTIARFSDYYDMEFYNELSVKKKGVKLISWEVFRDEAPRTVIVVSIPTRRCLFDYQILEKKDCVISKKFNLFINGLIGYGFQVNTTICLTCSALQKPMLLQDFRKLLLNRHNEITIVINSWRNYEFTLSWLQLPQYCRHAESPRSSDQLVPSSLIINHTRHYLNYFIKKKRIISIMLRIERFLTLSSSGRLNESVQSCLNKTLSIYDTIFSPKTDDTFITVDIGRYGSGIMQNKKEVSFFGKGSIESITESVEYTFNHIYKGKLSLTEWEETFDKSTNGMRERGYIAMLQRNIASESDCLILMGGGSFQQVAAFQYLNNIKQKGMTPFLYTICVADSFKELFAN